MRKLTLMTVSLAVISSSAFAGGLAPVVVEPVPVVEEKAASSISPLVLLGILLLIGIAISQQEEEVFAPSDIRLKSDVIRVGTAANGLSLYHFRYTGFPTVYEGVMAQDVLGYRPEAVVDLPFGFLAVDYKMLGLEMKVVQ